MTPSSLFMPPPQRSESESDHDRHQLGSGSGRLRPAAAQAVNISKSLIAVGPYLFLNFPSILNYFNYSRLFLYYSSSFSA